MEVPDRILGKLGKKTEQEYESAQIRFKNIPEEA